MRSGESAAGEIGRGVSSSDWFGSGGPGDGERPEGARPAGGGRRPPNLRLRAGRGPLAPTIVILVVLGFVVSLAAAAIIELPLAAFLLRYGTRVVSEAVAAR